MIVAVNLYRPRATDQPMFLPRVHINFAEFPDLLYIVSNRVCSTRIPVAVYSTARERFILSCEE